MKLGRKREMLEVLGRRHYARLNFLCAYAGGHYQNRRVEVAELHKSGDLILHPPNGNNELGRVYPRTFHRIYEKPGAHKTKGNQFWHQIFLDDILLSIEIACNKAGLAFRDREEVLRGKPFVLPTKIENTSIEPDAIFAIEDTYFVLEADRGTEPIERPSLKQSSYYRKMLQYRDVMQNQTHKKEWGIPNLKVLNITTKPERVNNLMEILEREGMTPLSMCFKAYPSLASTLKSPKPLLSILADPMQRVGHPDFHMGLEVLNGYDTRKKTA